MPRSSRSSPSADRSVQAASFGGVAAAYERGRPSYPPAALDWLLPPGASRVLDLGAGTGKLTRRLRERHLDVLAVEPSPQMRAEFSRVLPDVRVLDGRAEALPLPDAAADPDAAVDVVLVAQAWHWVDAERAVPEVARVLAPGGRLGLLWNVRDERQDWVRRLGEIIHAGREAEPMDTDPTVGAPFGPVERFTVEWTAQLAPQAVVDLVASRSQVSTMPAPRRRAVLVRVRDLLEHHPELAGRDEVRLPYLTRCTRTALR